MKELKPGVAELPGMLTCWAPGIPPEFSGGMKGQGEGDRAWQRMEAADQK